MLPDVQKLTELLQTECGLPLSSQQGKDADGQNWILFQPAGSDARHTFGVRATISWRRLNITLEPGAFASGLLEDMAATDAQGVSVFQAVLADCAGTGAEISMRVNGQDVSYASADIWTGDWKRLTLVLSKGGLELGADEGRPDLEILLEWLGRFFAAIIAILPVENDIAAEMELQVGFPEGAKTTVLVNRYERDRRNRAAAIAIHGSRCKCCEIDFGEKYGHLADGFIEIHHLRPVSELGPDYIIDPRVDLVPLCPNCHAVAHRTDPPLTVDAVRSLLDYGRANPI